jgi:hypothetical protein
MHANAVDVSAIVVVISLQRPLKLLYCDHNCGCGLQFITIDKLFKWNISSTFEMQIYVFLHKVLQEIVTVLVIHEISLFSPYVGLVTQLIGVNKPNFQLRLLEDQMSSNSFHLVIWARLLLMLQKNTTFR